MTSIKKILCIIISVMIIASLSIMTAYASVEVGAADGGGEVIVTPGDGGDSGDIGGGDDSGDIGGGDDSGDIGGGGDSGDISGGDSSDVSGGDSGDVSGGDSSDSSSGDSGSSGYVDSGSSSGTYDSSSIYNSSGYVTNNDSSYYYFDEEEAAKSGDPNISKVEGEAELYNTSGQVNSKDLQENEWSDIKLDTTTTVTPAAGSGSFNSIKENKDTNDNSQWILYIGIVLIGLSALGILYFVVATAVYKKRLDELTDRENKNTERRRQAYYDPDEFSDIEDLSYKVNNTHKYSTNTRRKSRQNTQEVRLPRRYMSRH